MIFLDSKLIFYEKFINNDFLKEFDIVGNWKIKCGECGHLNLLFGRIAKVGRKV